MGVHGSAGTELTGVAREVPIRCSPLSSQRVSIRGHPLPMRPSASPRHWAKSSDTANLNSWVWLTFVIWLRELDWVRAGKRAVVLGSDKPSWLSRRRMFSARGVSGTTRLAFDRKTRVSRTLSRWPWRCAATASRPDSSPGCRTDPSRRKEKSSLRPIRARRRGAFRQLGLASAHVLDIAPERDPLRLDVTSAHTMAT